MENVQTEERVERVSIVTRIEELNANVEKQMSVWYVFRNGIIYGIGFIIGSTVLTTLVISFVLTFFSHTVVADVIMWFARSGR